MPYCLILLDEIEKAHRDVLNILLQVLDEGHLTDSKGVTVDCRNTIIVMTSNVGANYLSLSASYEDHNHDLLTNQPSAPPSISPETRHQVMSALRSTFSPEFLNRIDETVIFNRLSKENMSGIVDVRIKDVFHFKLFYFILFYFILFLTNKKKKKKKNKKIERRLESRRIELMVLPEAKQWLVDVSFFLSFFLSFLFFLLSSFFFVGKFVISLLLI